MLFLLYPDTYKLTMTTDGVQGFTPFVLFLIASAILTILGLLIFRFNILRAEIRSRKMKGQVYTDTKKAIKRKLTFPFYLLDPLKRKKPIGRFSNPVFVAEMRSKLFANSNFVIRTVSAIFIISLGMLTLLSFQLGEEIHAGSVRVVAIVFQIGIVALLAPGVSSGLITDEITAGTFDSLRMTPISPLTLIFGKLKATFFYALIFLISSIFILLFPGNVRDRSGLFSGPLEENDHGRWLVRLFLRDLPHDRDLDRDPAAVHNDFPHGRTVLFGIFQVHAAGNRRGLCHRGDHLSGHADAGSAGGKILPQSFVPAAFLQPDCRRHADHQRFFCQLSFTLGL